MYPLNISVKHIGSDRTTSCGWIQPETLTSKISISITSHFHPGFYMSKGHYSHPCT